MSAIFGEEKINSKEFLREANLTEGVKLKVEYPLTAVITARAADTSENSDFSLSVTYGKGEGSRSGIVNENEETAVKDEIKLADGGTINEAFFDEEGNIKNKVSIVRETSFTSQREAESEDPELQTILMYLLVALIVFLVVAIFAIWVQRMRERNEKPHNVVAKTETRVHNKSG